MTATLLLAVLAACTYRLEAPAAPDDPVEVYVVNYGRHTSLALPSSDGGWTEWFWGDWNYYALGNRSLGDGLQALFASPRATLGYRRLVSLRDAGARKLLPLAVERNRVAQLQARLSARYARRRDAEVAHSDGRRFVPDDTPYRLMYNSSHRVADWLRELGVDVRGGGINARFSVQGAN